MKIEDHQKALDEHKEVLFKWALDFKGLENSQRIIGLHTSRAAIELLSIFLRKNKLISRGFQVNHRWFKSKKVSDRLPEFKDKDAIIEKWLN